MEKKLTGFQIESTDGAHDIPDTFFSFEVFPEVDVDRWLDECNFKDGKDNWMWKKVPIYDGDIEEPDYVNIYY